MSYSLVHKVVMVTGASSGIGEACAKAFSKAGARVVLAARSKEELERVGKSLNGEYLIVPCDVTREEDCKNLITQTLDRFEKIDILVNNAGISMRARFMDCQMDVIEKVMKVNFWGSVYCTKFALPHLLKSKGSIVVISTTAGFIGLPGRTGYSASKFALHGFFDTIRSEHLDDGLHVAMIFPGFTTSNIRKNALTSDGSKQGNSPRNEAGMISAETVANRVIAAIVRKKRNVLIGGQSRLIWWLRMFFPAWLEKAVNRRMKKEIGSPFQ